MDLFTPPCTSWNDAAERMYGYTASEAVGQPITLLFPPSRQDEFAAIMEQMTRGERVNNYETKRLKYAVNIFSDITARMELEQRKDEFIGMASHELKPPITSLKATPNC
jgi:signal transduction histidine kinase